jgi:hypothetical protein
MTSIEKPNNSNLENDYDFGDSELNKLFKGLDEKTQKEILHYPTKEIHIEILKNMSNPEIQNFYKNYKNKDQLDNLKIRDKYSMIKKLLKQQKPNLETKPIVESKTLLPEKIGDVKEPENIQQFASEEKLKIAIIIPFRDSEKNGPRTKQLNKLVDYMQTYLAGEDYKIFVITQTNDGRKFNRGQLLNVGFEIADAENYDIFIFHDVDLLPSPELKKYYITYPKKPVHIASVWDRYGSNPSYFGGIVAFNRKMFLKINGFPNNFWGWGGEDDELLKRTKKFYEIIKPTNGSIQDLENLNLQEKLDYLRENELKFMSKKEALAKHETTWKTNGLNQILNFNQMIFGEYSCGHNCEQIQVGLLSDADDEDISIDEKSKSLDVTKDIQQELFKQEEPEVFEEKDRKITPQEAFNNLVKTFYDLNLYRYNVSTKTNNELEIRFATKGIKQLTKNDYDNVVKLLKSFNFKTVDSLGKPLLRIRSEFLDTSTGKFKMSDIRTEIEGIVGIENYCRSDDIKSVYKKTGTSVTFTSKRPFILPSTKQMIRPIDMNDFNFRISLQTEQEAKKGLENYIIDNWRKSKKEFRYLNRVTFTHDDFPVNIDLSIVKTGNKGKDKRGFMNIIPVNTLSESNVFNNPESYEIEIELDNSKIGPGTKFQTPESILVALRKVIKYILSGLQGTLYPISYPEQEQVLKDYMKMIWGDEYEPSRRITSQNFIGPNSITLQLTNIANLDENSTIPNIRKDFVVTEKADGERHLMYISSIGKIYLISSNMDVKFSGAKTLNQEYFNTLIDGELISHDKNGKFINLYAAFDIYFHKNKDIRNASFLFINDSDKNINRYYILEKIRYELKPISILDTHQPNNNFKSILQKYIAGQVSPIRFEVKNFYPMSTKQTIFDGCKTILQKEKEGLFEYETDGLIFTHAYYGVGSNVIGKSGPKTKITWEYSFKWKPPQFNTIDFLITTTKTPTGEDVIKSLYEDGISASSAIQHNEYKTIELRCGFNERTDGYINPCQDIINDNLPEYKPRFEEKQGNDYVPKRFYPTEPYNPNAGLCNLMLRYDDAGVKQMFAQSGEVITDNTIVEFAYDIDSQEGWNWKPLRVRHDKTAKLRRGEKEYGNSYKVCNENWKSIHPTGRITEDMLMTGLGIPDVNVSEDKYYNTPTGKLKTEALKNFHNLYVKKMLINGVAKQGDTLIDYACGKAGDLPKWISARLSFVFGIDYSEDNLENRLDGACARYLNAKKNNKYMPSALFVHGNSANNIKDGTALLNDKAKQISAAVFGNGVKDVEKIGKGVAKLYGKGDGGFNISSCQFALHYFFENPDTLKGFLKNLVECTKLNGYFIGTCYDGKSIFNKLKKVKPDEGVKLVDEGKQICEIVKYYTFDTFDNNSSSLGYKISVCQESINQYIYEYLVNFEYLDRLLDAYGFKLITIEEANEMGLPSGSGMFSELFINMLDEIKNNKYKSSIFGEAPNMTLIEKELSFLNRYFVYKKIREVNVDKLYLELGEYEDTMDKRAQEDSKKAVVIAKEEETKIKPKVRKLQKKLLLIAATEAVDEPVKKIEEEINKKTAKKAATKSKKLVIIDEED